MFKVSAADTALWRFLPPAEGRETFVNGRDGLTYAAAQRLGGAVWYGAALWASEQRPAE